MNTNTHIPNDTTLPMLGTALDGDDMASRFDRHFNVTTRGRIRVRACAVDRIKYRPGRSCVTGYRLELDDQNRAETQQHRIYGSLFNADEAERRYQAMAHEASADDFALPACGLMPDMPMLFWHFPYDRKLHALPLLTNPIAMCRAARRLGAVIDLHGELTLPRTQLEVVSYFPEHACTARLTLLAHGSSGEARHWYCKTRCDDAGAETYRVMRELEDAIDSNACDLHLAKTLAYDHEQRMLWQQGVSAPTLAELIERNQCNPVTLERVARALARFHDAAISVKRSKTLTILIAQLHEAENIIARAAPDQTASLRATVSALTQRTDDVDPSLDATVHGDLHSHNVLISNAATTLIDLDVVAQGMRLADLGSFMAELATRACVSGDWPDASMLNALVRQYGAAAARRFPAHEIAWHYAAALIGERAKRCVTSLKPGRMAALPRVIEVARQAIERPWTLTSNAKPVRICA